VTTTATAPEVDVVIVTFGSARHVAGALTSLPSWARPLVVENGSHDGGADVARAAGAAVVENRDNLGFAAAANQGAAQGEAPYVLFLNPDARIEEGDLRTLVARLQADATAAAVGPRLSHADGASQRGRWPFPSSGETWRWAVGLRLRAPLAIDDGGEEGGFLTGACLLVRREAFRQVGGFDLRYWLYGEEADLCWRLRQAGWGVHLVPEAAALHVGGASGDPESELIVEHFDRGTERLIQAREGVGGLLRHRAGALVGTALRSVVAPRDRRNRRRLRGVLRRLVHSPTAVPLRSPATAVLHGGLVVCSLEPWDTTLRRNQLLVEELLLRSPTLRVLFVEPPYDRVLEARRGHVLPRHRGLRSVRPDGRILCFQPVKTWPRVLGPLADRSLRRQVRAAARRVGFRRPVLWINDAAYAAMADEPGWPTVYDITDDWLEASTSPRAHRRLARWEARLFADADQVVVCSPGLADTRRAARPDLHLVPNGVHAEHFRVPRARPDALPPGRTAVYVGTLHEDRLDVDLLVQLAGADPSLSVVLVGPDALAEASRQRLVGLANVHLLGPQAHEEVPAYLQHADVVVIPHVLTSFTESLDPIKAYECLAVGRPTVATPVAGFRGLADPVRVVARERWVDAVLAVADRDLPSDPQPVPTWTERAEAFEGVLLAARRAQDERPLRVLRVWHSGVVRTWRGRERALRARGLDVTLVCARRWNEGGRDVDFEQGDAFARPVRAFGRHPYRFVYAPFRLFRLLRSGELDLLDLHEEPASLATGELLLLRHLARCEAPFLLYSAQNIEKRYPPPFRWIERWALRHAAGVHVCNEEAGAILRRKGLQGEVEVLGLGVELEDFERPRVAASPPVVGFVGRLERYKGVHVLVEAMASVPGARLRLVGDGPMAAALEAQVQRLGLADRVELQGFVAQEDVAEQLRHLDVLVVPSIPNERWTEQFGRVAVEAMAAGVPVVVSRAGALPDVVGEAGLLVEPDDPAALAAAIRGLLADPAEAGRLAARARVRVERYRWSEIAAQQHDLYLRVLA
jgi:glycosyltransferase involved in cell wall biosynthesis/GT2 family glycosyltransferase